MREYEIMIIAKPDLPPADITKMISKWEGIIATEGGQIIKKDDWGVRKLAYPIGKHGKGHYFVYDVAATPSPVKELDRILKLDENVLRPLIIKLGDKVDIEKRRVELEKQAEERARIAAQNAQEKAQEESSSARRRDDEEQQAPVE
jgi:small subunit ribosomal protein S6